MKIKNNYMVSELDIKRFYLPCDLIVTCPKCGAVIEHDQYVSFPIANKPFNLDLYCFECEHEWIKEVKIVLGLEEV